MKLLNSIILVIAATGGAVLAAPIEETPTNGAEQVQLPEGEKRLRRGIILLSELYQCMAQVNNKATAEAAVPKIMQLNEELQKWTQAFNNLPPLTEPEVLLYEDRYLPIIRKINNLIKDQADRLGAAEYYGSINLPAALVRTAQVGH